MVSFAASASTSSSGSQQAAMKTASKYAKDVTDKSSEKIAQRILTRTSKTVTTTIEETNSHEVNNKDPGAKHIAGVYQWVNKVYEACSQLWPTEDVRTHDSRAGSIFDLPKVSSGSSVTQFDFIEASTKA